MLRRMKDLKGLAIGAKDGDIGEVNDFVFDDKNWTVRYLVADTSRWLPGRKVLISPIIVDQADWEGKRLPVLLTKEQVKNSPDINMDENLSAQDEIKYYNYYGWPYYWAGDEIWGPVTVPQDMITASIDRKIALTEQINQSHLRSMKDVTGYTIQATDGEIGEVHDFIVDDEPWVIRYMIVDTGNWWPGKKVLVAPPWIANVDWKNSKVYINLSRETVKSGPEFDPDRLDRSYEQELHNHSGQEIYWWC
jgi:sporulation protein YlmC with PRC-barrel domain